MQNVFSSEYYRLPEGAPVHVLKKIAFEAHRGESWSILGPSIFEIMLLTEIMAGARVYEKGACSLSGHGMMRRKRNVLDHTFYIGSTHMLFGNMKMLEYLMFITSKSRKNVLARQKEIIEKIEAAGLAHVMLTPIERLTPEETAVVTLFSATFCQSRLFILNLPRLQYDAKLVDAMARIAGMIRADSKALVLTTACFDLAQAVSTHVMLIGGGTVRYQGELDSLTGQYDHVLYLLRFEDAKAALPLLRQTFPQFSFRADPHTPNQVQLLSGSGADTGCNFFRMLGNAGITPSAVIRNKPNLRNAYDAVMQENQPETNVDVQVGPAGSLSHAGAAGHMEEPGHGV